jgi:hypothetical protein
MSLLRARDELTKDSNCKGDIWLFLMTGRADFQLLADNAPCQLSREVLQQPQHPVECQNPLAQASARSLHIKAFESG